MNQVKVINKKSTLIDLPVVVFKGQDLFVSCIIVGYLTVMTRCLFTKYMCNITIYSLLSKIAYGLNSYCIYGTVFYNMYCNIAFIMGNAFINQQKYKQIKCLNIRVDSINYFNYICFYNNVSSNVLFIIEFNMITCHGLRKKYIILVNYQSPSVQ